MNVLCFGCGVNSVSLLILHRLGKVHLDLAIFADTGLEHPETYEYLENVAKPYCRNIGIELVQVKSERQPLYEFYFSRKIIPSRMFRHCTDHYKRQPIKKYCKQFSDYTFILGIAREESHRAKDWENVDYPLVRLGIDREECKRLIKSEGLPLPIKSGCYICPFTPLLEWKKLLKTHEDLFLKAEALEKNCQRYPEFILSSKPLEYMRKGIKFPIAKTQRQLCNFGLEKCSFCET